MASIENVSFDARWNAWRARGEAHERLVRRRAMQVLPAIALAVATVYAFSLMW